MKDTKHILSPGSCPRGGSLGHLGYSGGSNIFFKHGHVAYQINGDDEQNKMQATFLSYPRVNLVTLGRCQKVQYL